MKVVLLEKNQYMFVVDYEHPLEFFSQMQLHIMMSNEKVYDIDDTSIYIIREIKLSLERLLNLNDVRRELGGESLKGNLGKLFNEYSYLLENKDTLGINKYDDDPTANFSFLSGAFIYRLAGRYFIEISDWYPLMYSDKTTYSDFQKWLMTEYKSYVLELTESEVLSFKENVDRLNEEMKKNSVQYIKNSTP